MLPVRLVQPVIVKNTFLDFDDAASKRASRRCKTEGAINIESDVEVYDQSPRRNLKIEVAFPADSHVEVYDNDEEASTSSPTSAYGRCMTDNSNCSEGPGAQDSNPPSEKQQFKEERKPVMLLSEMVPSSVVTTALVSSTAPTIHHWTIDARKLRSNDRSVVSRPFTFAIGGPGSEGVTCKMMLYARTLKMGKAGQSFKFSGGQGSLQLKCEQDLTGLMRGGVALRFSIGNGKNSKLVEHDFSQSAACSSPEWDFASAVDKSSHTLVVSVEVVTA